MMKTEEDEFKKQYRRDYYNKNKARIQKYQKQYYKEKRETSQTMNGKVRPYTLHSWKGEKHPTITITTGCFILTFD